MRLQDNDIRIEVVRDKILAAFDDAATELYGDKKFSVIDADLPELFRTIDEMANRMLLRAAGYVS